MRINLDEVIESLDGEPITINEMVDGEMIDEELTLGRVCLNSLFMMDQTERIDGIEKFKRYEMGLKVNLGGTQSFTAEQISLIKELVGKMYGPLIVGRAWTLLEGEEEEPVSE
jgi:hypothetical protein